MNLISKQKQKKAGATVAVLFLAVVLLVFSAKGAHAGLGDALVWAAAKLLTLVLTLVGYLINLAAVIFAWVLDPKIFDSMMKMAAVKNTWTMVRDLLNMAFILVLLFAAFCTVFQVDKWNLKKVWLGVLLNALLVNFSFPIARFFIDISNTIMYALLNNMFEGAVGGDGIFASLLAGSKLANSFAPSKPDIPFLVAAIIFSFIFGMTLMIIAGIFVVRMIALTALVMFSPIGFVGYIFPSTEKFAGQWWDNLIKYCFSGPIMVFVLSVSVAIIKEVQAGQFAKFTAIGSKNGTPEMGSWLGETAFLVIPLVILWYGISAATSGIAGASTITGKVKAGGNWLRKNPAFGLVGLGWRKSGAAAGVKKGWEDARKSGKLFGSEKFGFLKDGQADRDARMSGLIGRGWKDRNKSLEGKKAEEFRKKYKEKADEYDRTDSLGADGLVDEILKADLHDPSKRDGDALKVAAMLHALKQGDKKDDYELKLKEEIQIRDARALRGYATDGERDVHIKKEIAKNWKILNDKAKQANDVASKGETTAPAINKATAIASGAIDVWT
jgi:hypothetical protein